MGKFKKNKKKKRGGREGEQRDQEKEVHFNMSPPEEETKPFGHRPAAASTMTARAPVVIARTVPGSKYHLVKPNSANGHGSVINATGSRVQSQQRYPIITSQQTGAHIAKEYIEGNHVQLLRSQQQARTNLPQYRDPVNYSNKTIFDETEFTTHFARSVFRSQSEPALFRRPRIITMPSTTKSKMLPTGSMDGTKTYTVRSVTNGTPYLTEHGVQRAFVNQARRPIYVQNVNQFRSPQQGMAEKVAMLEVEVAQLKNRVTAIEKVGMNIFGSIV